MSTGPNDSNTQNPFEQKIAAAFPEDPRNLDNPSDVTGSVFPHQDGGDDDLIRSGLIDEGDLKDFVRDSYTMVGRGDAVMIDGISTEIHQTPNASSTSLHAADAYTLAPELMSQLDTAQSQGSPDDSTPNTKDLSFKTHDDLTAFLMGFDLPPVTTYQELVEYLRCRDLTDEEAFSLILQGNEGISKEKQMEIWESQVRGANMTDEEVMAAINRYLSDGMITYIKVFSYFGMDVTIEAHSRTAAGADAVEAAARQVMVAGNYTEEQVEKERLVWRIATSLAIYQRGANELSRGDKTLAAFVDEIRKVNSVTFNLLATAVQKVETLTYLASQRIAIENF